MIGLKERNHNRALETEPEPGDRIVLYITRVKACAGSIPVEDEFYEAFQGQIRPVSEHDATVLTQRLGAGTPAAR